VGRQASPLAALRREWIETRMAAARRLAAELARRGAQRVILYGSLAADPERVGPDSDVDIVVVMPGVEHIRFHRRLADAEEVQRFPYPLDLSVYSPAEWEEMQTRAFVRDEILRRGMILH
jgi:predicted nucleotidyltransferase